MDCWVDVVCPVARSKEIKNLLVENLGVKVTDNPVISVNDVEDVEKASVFRAVFI